MKILLRTGKALVFLFVSLILLSIIGCATTPSSGKGPSDLSTELIKLETRPGVTTKFILIKPEKPVASVILLDGYGFYSLHSLFGKPVVGKAEYGILVRTREELARRGFMVALVDAPSDQEPMKNPPKGLDWNFRLSIKHVKDIEAVSAYLKKQKDVPVWLIGMCMGALSVANGGVNIKEGVDGLVFVSSVSTLLRGYPFDKITVPALILAHKKDACGVTPPSGAEMIKAGLVNSPKSEARYFTGGSIARIGPAGPCQPLSHHGFYGIETEVIDAISSFIKSNSH